MGSKSFKITENEAKEIVKKCFSIADFCREVGWQPRGSNYKTFHRYEKEYGLDTSHFHPVNKNSLSGGVHERKTAEDYANGRYVKSSVLLKKMVSEGIKEWKCECCGRSEWLGDKIPLELHHKDGNHLNNSFDNIEFLCPNCHAKTDSYRGKNIGKGQKSRKCKVCGKPITRWAKNGICSECSHKIQRKVNRPEKEVLKSLLHEYSFVAVSKMFGVSDNAVRKWCKSYGLSTRSCDYKLNNDLVAQLD